MKRYRLVRLTFPRLPRPKGRIMNRREFFRPRRIAHVAGQVLGAMDEIRQSFAPETPREEIALLRIARGAMATTFEIMVPFGTLGALEASNAALDEIDRIEDQLTVYRDHSEVSVLNRLAFSEPVPVEKDLFELLSYCSQLHRDTDGAFDVTTGALIKAWGIFRRAQKIPLEEELESARAGVGMQAVSFDRDKGAISFMTAGIELNLGSIGKGYALDRAARLLQNDWNLSCCMLHGGYSSVYAMGSEPGKRYGWAVGVRHPYDPEKRLAILRIRDQGLGTSAATFQHIKHNGRRLGHLLDPRTGWPAEDMASVTVVAPTAQEADALATAFFILGIEKTAAYCTLHPQVKALLLPSNDGELLAIGFDPHEIDWMSN